MTEQEAKTKLLTTARGLIGMHESGDNIIPLTSGDWDNQLYGWELTGQPWCDVFVDYCFIETFGYTKGAAMTYQQNGGSAACKYSAAYYQQNNAYYSYPEIGDQIFFYYGGNINHTGIVESIEGEGKSWTSVTTIEGNTSDMVARRTYRHGDYTIAGFGRPKWSLVSDNNSNLEQNISNNEEKPKIPTTFKVGDIVQVKPGSYYYNSRVAVPTFVLNDSWIIMSIYNKRAVLNKNVNGTRSIMSPISTDNLIKVEENTESKIKNDVAPTYVVHRGDTLWGIAQSQLGDGAQYNKIKELNNLTSDVIQPGQVLLIPQEE